MILGRRRGGLGLPWRRTIAQRIAAQSPDIDLIELGVLAPAKRPAETIADSEPRPMRPPSYRRYLWAFGNSMATTLVKAPLSLHLDLANIV